MYTNQPRQMPHRDLPKHNSFIKIRRVPRPRPFLAKPLPQASSLYGLKMEEEGGEGGNLGGRLQLSEITGNGSAMTLMHCIPLL